MGEFGYGQLDPSDSGSDFAVIAFVVRQMMAQMATTKLVRVEAVHAGQGELAAPTVDVLPLVSQVDGNGNVTPHGTVYGLPVLRLQAGACAIILDPIVGDVGFVVCCDRDISAAKAATPAPDFPINPVTPGSMRKFDLADGIYVGGTLNAQPTCYVRLREDGSLKIADAFGNVLETTASGFSLTGDVAVTGNITATGTIHAGEGGPDRIGLQTHLHTSAAAGNPTSTPTAGT